MKRLNPQTNKPFKRWDEDDRGYVFWTYQKTVIKKNGFFQESWLKKEKVDHLRPLMKSRETENITKRLNPETGNPFRRWDKDPEKEGYVFWGYRTKEANSKGFCLERWKKYDEVSHLNPFGRLDTVGNPKLRLNPQTGSPFQRWDVSENGKVFWRYRDKPNKRSGYLLEDWRDPDNLPYEEPQEPEITFLKQCTKCFVWKVRSDDFYKSDTSYDGRESWCKTCKNIQGKKYYSKNKDKHSQLTQQYYENNKVEISQKFRDRYKNDPEFRKQKLVQYYLREERTKLCTPNWVKPDDLTPFYEEARRKTEETGIKHHVDHIIPISHDLICGLNCPSNLQVLTAEENLRKSNKFEIEF